jgi:excisionase family DNA binding protein
MGSHRGRATLTIEEAAERLGVSRKHAYELAAADRLPVAVIRLGRRLVVGRAALERVLAGEPIRREGPGDDAT